MYLNSHLILRLLKDRACILKVPNTHTHTHKSKPVFSLNLSGCCRSGGERISTANEDDLNYIVFACIEHSMPGEFLSPFFLTEAMQNQNHGFCFVSVFLPLDRIEDMQR